MKILAHRGFWLERSEQNTFTAFSRAFSHGYGIETDLRDFHGRIVISHDPPLEAGIYFEDLLVLHEQIDKSTSLALNVKSDGLQLALSPIIKSTGLIDYFLFDMAIPDAIQHMRSGFSCFTRQSEYEASPSFYELALGVWMDEFDSHWIDNQMILDHIHNNKRICIVSPELHGRPHESEWLQYRKITQLIPTDAIMLCTDHPVQANKFFNQE